jgi:uncharacterized protein (DUF608 family)
MRLVRWVLTTVALAIQPTHEQKKSISDVNYDIYIFIYFNIKFIFNYKFLKSIYFIVKNKLNIET